MRIYGIYNPNAGHEASSLIRGQTSMGPPHSIAHVVILKQRRAPACEPVRRPIWPAGDNILLLQRSKRFNSLRSSRNLAV